MWCGAAPRQRHTPTRRSHDTTDRIWALLLTFGTSGLALPTATAEVQTSNPVANRLIVPIAGTVDGVAQTLTGTLAITRFATQQNQLVAIGTLNRRPCATGPGTSSETSSLRSLRR